MLLNTTNLLCKFFQLDLSMLEEGLLIVICVYPEIKFHILYVEGIKS